MKDPRINKKLNNIPPNFNIICYRKYISIYIFLLMTKKKNRNIKIKSASKINSSFNTGQNQDICRYLSYNNNSFDSPIKTSKNNLAPKHYFDNIKESIIQNKLLIYKNILFLEKETYVNYVEFHLH